VAIRRAGPWLFTHSELLFDHPTVVLHHACCFPRCSKPSCAMHVRLVTAPPLGLLRQYSLATAVSDPCRRTGRL
jgi:hypothetical protein